MKVYTNTGFGKGEPTAERRSKNLNLFVPQVKSLKLKLTEIILNWSPINSKQVCVSACKDDMMLRVHDQKHLIHKNVQRYKR